MEIPQRIWAMVVVFAVLALFALRNLFFLPENVVLAFGDLRIGSAAYYKELLGLPSAWGHAHLSVGMDLTRELPGYLMNAISGMMSAVGIAPNHIQLFLFLWLPFFLSGATMFLLWTRVVKGSPVA